jgi:hypothetical protein
MFRKLSQKVIQFLDKRNLISKHVVIELNKTGLTITSTYPNKQTIQNNVDWSAIKSISVYKRDLFTFDQICMAIEVMPNETIEINETASGWDDLVMNIDTYLSSALAFEAWFFTVAFPAFETNLTKIYAQTEKIA